MLCLPLNSDVTALKFRAPSTYNGLVGQLFGSSNPERRQEALASLRAPDVAQCERMTRTLMTTLTDPSDEVRTAAMKALLPLLIEKDCEVKLDRQGKLFPPKGGVLEQFIQICLDPPICPHKRDDPRWDGNLKYDPRYGIITTRVMMLRAVQYSAPILPRTMDLLRQESLAALHAVEHQRDLITVIYPAKGYRVQRNVLANSLSELPARLSDGSLSSLATLLLLCAAGLSQSSNRLACPIGEHLKGNIGVGIWNTFVDLEDFAPALWRLTQSLQSHAPRRYQKWD